MVLEHEHDFASGRLPRLGNPTVRGSVGVRHGLSIGARNAAETRDEPANASIGATLPTVPVSSVPPPSVSLACPDCRGALNGEPLTCAGCGRVFKDEHGVPVLLPRVLMGETEARQHALYSAVAHEYDDVFPRHIADHYIDKRTRLVKDVLPLGGLVLDVGCGTGQLGAAIASEGYDVFGVDFSASMLGKARERGLVGTYAAVTTALPFSDYTFDLALTVATLHHLETPERVAATVSEMGRIVKRGGFAVLWDHNPANPYWPILMKRVPQDSGDERLVPQAELIHDVLAARLMPHRVFRSGFTPDFLPRPLIGVWRWVERAVEVTPGVNVLAAHNVVIARKP